MATLIQIQPKTSDLAPGKSLRVPIVATLDEPLKVRGLHAMFLGAEETKATYTTYNAATKTTQTHTAVQHVEIVRQNWLLSGNERLGFFGNLADGLATLFGGGEHDTLLPGAYAFDVEIEVPAAARATFSGKKCRVFYELTVQIDVPLAFDVKATYGFTLRRPETPPPPELARTRYPEDQGRGLLDSWFGPDLRVEAAVPNNVFRPGETIDGVFRVDAPTPLECRKISARLVAFERSQAQGHKDTHVHRGPATVVATPGTIDRSYKQDFQLPVWSAAPASTRGQLFSIDWFVQIELDVPWAKDPQIRVPVVMVGE
jgi:hypothetical protein